MDDVLTCPASMWRERVKLPHDVSYYMKWDSIDPGEGENIAYGHIL